MTSTLQTIIAGWRQASKVALQALENSALSHVEDEEKFREDLMNIARTTISSKILSQHKDFFAKLAVDAVLRLKGSGNLDAIQIIKIQGGSLDESFLDSGSHILKILIPSSMMNRLTLLLYRRCTMIRWIQINLLSF